MLKIPEIAIGAIVASLIAGLISLLGLIISKEQKTSEFRQAWIDALRSELSVLIAHTSAIYGAQVANFQDLVELWKDLRADYFGMNDAIAKIRLRLNPKEPQAQAILATIEALEAYFASGRTLNLSEFDIIEKRLVGDAQVLLKKEWGRVQAGEPTYKIARYAALAVSIACIVALGAVAVAKATGV